MGTLKRAGRARRKCFDEGIRLSLAAIFGALGGMFSFELAFCKVMRESEWSRGLCISGGSDYSRGLSTSFLGGDRDGVLPLRNLFAIILFAFFSRQYLHKLMLQYLHGALKELTRSGTKLGRELSNLEASIRANGDAMLFVVFA